MKWPYGVFFLFLLLIFTHFPADAQNTRYKDSLFKVLATAPEDTVKVINYLTYGGLFELTAPDSAILYDEKARQLTLRLNYKKGLGKYLIAFSRSLTYKGNYQEALEGQNKAFTIFAELKDDRDIAIVYNNLASEYQYMGNMGSALEYYMKGNKLSEKIADKRLLRIYATNIATLFINLNDYDKAGIYADQSYAIAGEIGDTSGMAYSLNILAICEKHQKKYEAAIRHLDQVIQLGKNLDDFIIVVDGYISRGDIYIELTKYGQGIQQYQTALGIARQNKAPPYELECLGGLSDAYIALHQWKEADKYITKAIPIARKEKAQKELSEMCLKASQIKEGMGDFKAALTYKKEYEILNDTLLNEKIRNNINKLDAQYQTVKKDKAIADQNFLLEKNRSVIRNRNTWLGLSLGGILLLLLLTILSYRFYQQKQKLNGQAILALQKEQEVMRLKSRMEGQDQERQRISKEMHDDIGAGLTAISYLSGQFKTLDSARNSQAAAKISNTANALVDKMNEIVWSMNKEHDSLEDLTAYLRHNTGELLENTNIAYQFIVPDNIPPITLTGEQRRNIYLVVKESLHNVIKHAGSCLVTIVFDIDPVFLQITIRDNGKGIEMSELRRFGNGLKNMRERMKNIGGGFEIIADGGTMVRLTVPIVV